jgi:5-methylcytosine-specific restriction enzyme subunit McrC
MTAVIPVRNVYYLFAYAWDQFRFTRRIDTGTESGPDAASFFATVLVQGCQQMFRRGVDRAYQTHHEEKSRLRGRIDVIKTARHESLKKGRVWCEFDDLEFNVIQNQLIKATLKRLLVQVRHYGDASSQLVSGIRGVVRTLESAGVADIKIQRQLFRRVQIHRNNAFCGFILHVCELVHEGLFPEHGGRAGPFASMMDDEVRMNRIFERFVRNFFRHEQRAFSVTSERIAWDLAGDEHRRPELLPSMQTDVSLRSVGRTIIVDTKYYAQTLHTHYDRKTLRSSHLYQLFAYVKNLECRAGADQHAEGILVYPTVQEEVDFRTVIQGHRIRAQTVDLAEPWMQIRERLLSLLDSPQSSAA